jgi:hypothetical protein
LRIKFVECKQSFYIALNLLQDNKSFEKVQLSPKDLKQIEIFNRNIKWLRESGLATSFVQGSAPAKVDGSWLSVKEACAFISRSRTWLSRITVVDATDIVPFPMKLIKGVDWKRETNRIMYKRSSLENLKKSMELAGDAYDERILSK